MRRLVDPIRRRILRQAYQAKRRPGDATEVLHDLLIESRDPQYESEINDAHRWARSENRPFVVLFSPRKYIEREQTRRQMARMIHEHFKEFGKAWDAADREVQFQFFKRLTGRIAGNAKLGRQYLAMIQLNTKAQREYVHSSPVDAMFAIRDLRRILLYGSQADMIRQAANDGLFLNVSGWQSALITHVALPPRKGRRR